MESQNTTRPSPENTIPSLDIDWFIRSKKSVKSRSRSHSHSLKKNDTSGHTTSKTISPKDVSADTATSPELHSRKEQVEAINETELTQLHEEYHPKTSTSSSNNANSLATSAPLRRTKSAPAPAVETDLTKKHAEFHPPPCSAPVASVKPEKKGGFLGRLFGRRKSTSVAPKPPSHVEIKNNHAPPQPVPSLSSPVITRPAKAHVESPIHNGSPKISATMSDNRNESAGNKTELLGSDLTLDSEHCHHHHHLHVHQNGSISSLEHARHSVGHLGTDGILCDGNEDSIRDISDKQLSEFLNYYKKIGASTPNLVPSRDEKADESTDKPTRFRKRASFQIDATSGPMESKRKIFDAKGRPIPPHPAKSQLPSALSKTNYFNLTVENSGLSQESSLNKPSSSNKFGAFLRRVTSYGASQSNEVFNPDLGSSHVFYDNGVGSSESSLVSDLSEQTYDPSRATTVPGLEDLKPLKHVSFATNTYFNDPPQQICSKNPRKGEVEVKPNGSVIIHRLTPQEKQKILEQSTFGIVVGGSGQLRLLNPEPGDDGVVSSASVADSQLGAKQSSHSDDEVKGDGTGSKSPSSSPDDEEVGVDTTASHLKIDKPMVSRRSATNILGSSLSLASSIASGDSENESEVFPPRDLKIPFDVVYTRCCHLREILPIPATLKQLRPGSTDSIPLFQLRNPRPSMVEVLSFSDFVKIAPILCLSLDGVHLTTEMFRIILSALSGKPEFEKLSLRNTPIDAEGWKLLAFFISKNKSLVALDLTMVPHIKTNVQKPSKSSLKKNIKRMECRMEDRSDMNWNLMTGAIAFRGGIEELILSGAKMSDCQFKNLIEVACIKNQRLGLAYNDLTATQCNILARWLVNSKVTGLDVGFNNLKGKLGPFFDAVLCKVRNKTREVNALRYLSLNCTGLEVGPNATSKDNEALKLLSILCYCENLLFLDLSNNPKMFPYCFSTLADVLPVFVKLIRLDLDFEDLTSADVVALSEIVPLCPRLKQLSLLGTELDLASCKALAKAVRKSETLTTLDVDYAYMPERIKDQISLYGMRNINKELKRRALATDKWSTEDNKNKIQRIQDELSALLTASYSDSDEEEYHRMVEAYIRKVSVSRKKIGKVIRDLFDLRMKGELNMGGKEALIGLCFIDGSLEKSIRLLKERHTPSTQNIRSKSPMLSNLANTEGHPRVMAKDGTIPQKTKEDLVRERDSSILSSSLGASGHTALLPFMSSKIENSLTKAADTVQFTDEGAPAPLLINPKGLSTVGVSPDVERLEHELELEQSQNGNGKPEGDDSNKGPNSTDSENKSAKIGDNGGDDSDVNDNTTLDEEAISRAAQSADSNQIKEFLLRNDLSSAVKVIDTLHSQGFHFHHIFKKQDQGKDILSSGNASPTAGASLGEKGDNKDSSTSDKPNDTDKRLCDIIPDNPEEYDKFMETQEDLAMDMVYDEVLDKLQENIQVGD